MPSDSETYFEGKKCLIHWKILCVGIVCTRKEMSVFAEKSQELALPCLSVCAYSSLGTAERISIKFDIW